jgi:hypothetical protein
MDRPIHDDPRARFDDYRIDRRLHDVPPHEVYAVRVDGRRAVYKRDVGPTGRAGVEGRVLAFVDRRTRVPVPTPLAVGDDWFVAARHPDAPEPDAGGTPDRAWARAAGRGLATLHADTAGAVEAHGRLRAAGLVGADDGDGLAAAGLAVEDAGGWHDAALAELRRRRETLARFGHGDVADAVREALCERPGAFAGAGGAVCCHGWATPAHVAVRDGRVRCVLDFEHAVAAPAEFDYWRTVLPTFDAGDRQAAFREGYEAVRALPDGVERRRPWFLALQEVYYLESLFVQDRHGDATTAERAARLRERVEERLADLS